MTIPGEEPGVKVTQEFLTPAPIYEEPDLFPVLIGQARQLEVDIPDGSYDSSPGGPNAATDLSNPYPDFTLNAVYTSGTLVAKIQNSLGTFDFDPADVFAEQNLSGAAPGNYKIAQGAVVERAIYSGTTGSFTAASTTFTDANARFITSNVVGDAAYAGPPIGTPAGNGEISYRLRITSGTNSGSQFVITGVSSQNDLIVDQAAVGVPTVWPPAANELNVQYSIVSVENAVGTLLISYEATRADLNDVLITITSDDDVVDQLGPIDPKNPLAFAASLAAANTSKQILATGVSADTTAEHQRALDFLEPLEVYSMVPLTQDTSILTLYQAHVNQQSTPESKHERRVYINRALVVREDRITTTDARVGGLADPVSARLWVDGTPGTIDYTSLVSPGDFILYNDGTAHELLVQTVSAGSLKVLSTGSVNYPIAPVAPGAAYTVVSATKSKTEQAQFLAAYAHAFSDKRVFFVWPDEAVVSVNGTNTVVSGYNVSAGVAALRSEERPQQPLTNLVLAGYSGLNHSNKYFSETQLRILSAGGMFILVHDTDGAPLRIRQQRSTDTSSLYKNEDSILAVVDYVAKFMRSELQPYIGKYNITPQYLDTLRVVVNGLFSRLRETTEVGPTILSGEVLELKQNDTELDHVDLKVRIGVAVPANFIDVLLQI